MSKLKIVLVDDSIHLKPYNQRHLAYTVVFRYLVSLNSNKACSLFFKEKQSIVLFAALILKFQDNFIHLRDHNKRFDFFQLALRQHPAFVAIFFNLINVDVFFQKIIRRYAGFKGSKFKRPAFTLSIKKNYTDDLTILFSRKRQRERERNISLSFYCVELWTGSKLQNILQSVFLLFSFSNRRSLHPRRPTGGQSGREKRCHNGFQSRAKNYKKSSKYCAHKTANSISWVLLVCSYSTAIASPYFCGSFTKE